QDVGAGGKELAKLDEGGAQRLHQHADPGPEREGLGRLTPPKEAAPDGDKRKQLQLFHQIPKTVADHRLSDLPVTTVVSNAAVEPQDGHRGTPFHRISLPAAVDAWRLLPARSPAS